VSVCFVDFLEFNEHLLAPNAMNGFRGGLFHILLPTFPMVSHLDQMANRHDRMAKDHSRTGVAHDFSNSLTSRFFVAINLAAAAGHFRLAMRAMFQAFCGVI